MDNDSSPVDSPATMVRRYSASPAAEPVKLEKLLLAAIEQNKTDIDKNFAKICDLYKQVLKAAPQNSEAEEGLARIIHDKVQELLGKLESDKEENQRHSLAELAKHLEEGLFVGEFVSQGGMSVMLEVVTTTSGNTLAVALKALIKTLDYVSAVEYVEQHPQFVVAVAGILDQYKSGRPNVSMHALKFLLFVVAKIGKGYKLVNKALKDSAKRSNVEVFSQVVSLFRECDINDIHIDTLTLLNLMITKAPDAYKRAKLARRLSAMGMAKAVEKKTFNLDEKGNPDLQAQAKEYQKLTAEVIPGSWYENSILKERVEHITEVFRRLEEENRALRGHPSTAASQLVASAGHRRVSEPSVSFSVREGIARMKEGAPILKVVSNGQPHYRTFKLSADETLLEWYSPKKADDRNSAAIAEFKEIRAGQTTPIFLKYNRADQIPLSLSIILNASKKISKAGTVSSFYNSISSKKAADGPTTIDLIFADASQYSSWKTALEYLVAKHNPSAHVPHISRAGTSPELSLGTSAGLGESSSYAPLSTSTSGSGGSGPSPFMSSMDLENFRRENEEARQALAVHEQRMSELLLEKDEIISVLQAKLSEIETSRARGAIAREPLARVIALKDRMTSKRKELQRMSDNFPEHNARISELVKTEEDLGQYIKPLEEMAVQLENYTIDGENLNNTLRYARALVEDVDALVQLRFTWFAKQLGDNAPATINDLFIRSPAERTHSVSLPPPAMFARGSQEGPLPDGSMPPPPPPGMPGAPPPPPMGLVSKGPQPNKPAVTPSIKMRQIYWKRIILDKTKWVDGATVWDNIDDDIAVTKDDVETAFGIRESSKEAAERRAAGIGAKKQTAVRILEKKRYEAVSIFMRKMPDARAILSYLLEMNVQKLPREITEQLILVLGTVEEMQLIEEAEKAGTVLDAPEQFLLDLHKFTNAKTHIRTWLFYLQFPETAGEIDSHVRQLLAAVQSVKSSRAFRKLLGVILVYGNYMNGGTNRGQADGFDLEILPKLRDVRDEKGASLYKYLVDFVKAKAPTVSMLPEELGAVRKARVVSLQQIKSAVATLGNDFRAIKTIILPVLSQRIAEGISHPFYHRMSAFINEADDMVSKLRVQADTLELEYSRLLCFFGLPEVERKKKATEDFFASVFDFIGGYEVATKAAEKPVVAEKKRFVLKEGKKLLDTPEGVSAFEAIIAQVRAGQLAKQ
eukprot:Opistho-2@52723